MRRPRVSRLKSAHDKEHELLKEAIMLRTIGPAETLRIVSELTDFAIKMNKVTENSAEEKKH
ncbi:MAG: hypothetical protein WED04_07175 [Promethearchaeati archaeon SRVP18_Atabeyarchaeia-1]